jgi:DNA repair exonuclease SbcCD nuclease subunit
MTQLRRLTGLPLPIIFLITISGVFSCIRDKGTSPEPDEGASITMAVFADNHYYDPSMGTSSDAFLDYIAKDRKLIAESHAIMEATVSLINNETAEIVLVAGDLTKDGSRRSHEAVVGFLEQIEAAGKIVYVIPGNHDIDNPNSYSFPDGSDPVPVPTITSSEFEQIYQNFGFAEAIARDPNSLTYIAEPKEGIWIFGMDDCNYENKYPDLNKTAGRFSEATLNWIINKISEAKSQGITPIGMVHHGILEHFPGKVNVFPDYVIDSWKEVSSALADAGMKLVFTGHYHANDIASSLDTDIIASSENGFIVDIETGSSLTWRCPYRMVELNGPSQLVDITTKIIMQINYDTKGLDFQTYARQFLDTGMPSIVIDELQSILGLDEAMALAIEPIVTPTLIIHFHGDEPSMLDPAISENIALMQSDPDVMTQILGNLLYGIWHDKTPDNDVTINLRNGEITNNAVLAKWAVNY